MAGRKPWHPDPLEGLGDALIAAVVDALVSRVEVRPLPDRLMTLAEAADYCGMQPETLRRAAVAGRVPAGKVGGEWRFSARALDEHCSAYQADEVAA